MLGAKSQLAYTEVPVRLPFRAQLTAQRLQRYTVYIKIIRVNYSDIHRIERKSKNAYW